MILILTITIWMLFSFLIRKYCHTKIFSTCHHLIITSNKSLLYPSLCIQTNLIIWFHPAILIQSFASHDRIRTFGFNVLSYLDSLLHGIFTDTSDQSNILGFCTRYHPTRHGKFFGDINGKKFTKCNGGRHIGYKPPFGFHYRKFASWCCIAHIGPQSYL